ncbi:malto-oligosyltrehalose synthase [Nitrosomonas sp. ANs5]|uniref:malto-oligosyltrehalose synthase n=1 Tax=Nitrosomonas sp. ANs5 TaxID=3423941 RepID=UPI003D3431A9
MQLKPIATYRLQLCPEFGLDDAAGIIPYLARLGVSHLYTSPYLQAASGSSHGYDVVDPTRVNEALGGECARKRLCAVMQQANLGQMLDIVPNHMAIIGNQNPWWWDVLENGPSSRFAMYFDVDWDASEERWPNKVLLPVLADHYGRILESCELQLKHAGGDFTLHYGEQSFPLDPSSLGKLLAEAACDAHSELLGFLAESCMRLPRPTVTDRRLVELRHRDKDVIQHLLTRLSHDEPDTVIAIDAVVTRLNADPDELDGLVDRQNYRLALWRTAGRDLGYRRFFDINNLAGLRVEEEEVFHATHQLPLAWVREGSVHGLRIDHADGLRDPAQYFARLRQACPDTWIVAEKILEHHERLPTDWPIAGTTGYDFLNLVGGLFIDPVGMTSLASVLEAFTGETVDFAGLVYESKRQVLKELLGSELNRLASLFVDICEQHRCHRDYTRYELYLALLETAASFPVYRTYVRAATERVTETDIRYVSEAITLAKERRTELDPQLFQFLENLLLLRCKGRLEGELAMRFQQLTGPAMAKGVEDTTFYRFHCLVSLNEVGGNPAKPDVSIAAFHQACNLIQTDYPQTLLTTASHDTKRGEDVRARLALLSEIPEHWGRTVQDWMQYNQQHRCHDLPDRNTEYLLYQTLVGAWPINTQRLSDYMQKAIREAKTHTSWTQPQPDYEQAIQQFVQAVLADGKFRHQLEAFVQPLIAPGRINSLAQTLLKLTAPGVPDIYQGTELWDLNLVDPDNRRPVDYHERAQLLAEIAGLTIEQILARSDEGLPKLWVIRQALHLRQQYAEYFGPAGSYQPLMVSGSKAVHAVAFMRGQTVAVVTPRLLLGLKEDWQDTAVELPTGAWYNLLTGDRLEGGLASVKVILDRFPVGLLSRERCGFSEN